MAVRDFTLMWNLFERFACNRNFSEHAIRDKITTYNINSVLFTEHLEYFTERYVLNNRANYHFDSLFNGQTNASRELVHQVLSGTNLNSDDIVVACIIISYRFRNNLFHGNKEIRLIHHQRNNLNVAISVMALFLDNIDIVL